MGLTNIPTEAEGSLGRDKEDIRPPPNKVNYIPADEYNAMKGAVAEMAAALGLGNGSTDGSLEQLSAWADSLASAMGGRFGAFDDFHTLDVPYPWNALTGSGGSVALLAGDHALCTVADSGSGLVQLATAAASGAYAGIIDKQTANGGMSPRFAARVKLPSGLGDHRVEVGMSDSIAFDGSAVYMSADASGWNAHADNNAGPATTDTAVAPAAASTWYEVSIELDASEARFYVDGSLVSTIGASLPQSSERLGMAVRCVNTSAVLRYAVVDYMAIRGSRR